MKTLTSLYPQIDTFVVENTTQMGVFLPVKYSSYLVIFYPS